MWRKKDTIKIVNLDEIFTRREAALQGMYYNITHPGESGTYLENETIKLINALTAKQYSVTGGFVVDFEENISDQIDLIIHQSTVSPPLFDEINYFFRESIALIGEVKATVGKKEFDYAREKINSVKNLSYLPGEIKTHSGIIKPAVDNKDQFLTMLFGYQSPLKTKTLKSHFEDSDLDLLYIAQHTKSDGSKSSVFMYRDNDGVVMVVEKNALKSLLFVMNHLLVTRINNTNPVAYKEWNE